MDEHRFDPSEIEPRWQRVWAEERTWEVSNDEVGDGRPTSYVLEMLPYPSGEPHIGHLKVYSVGDAVAHFHRRTGRRVLHPMGYDAFGLPAENHAIKTGQHPRDSTDAAIASFQRQFREWGISIDWTREFGTHEPRYYRWTQWIFLQLFERGLAYRSEAAVNWDPVEETVLANEQVVDGRGERSGALVEVRQLEQWFFRITDYADRLLDDLDTIEWPEHVKTMQRNWIGRSEGAEVTFRCASLDIDYPVFTTRPDTLFGATFFAMAPEHPDIERLVAGTGQEQAVREYVNRAADQRRRGPRRRRQAQDRRAAGAHGDQPGQRRGAADVRRRLRAHGVRHRRDHGGARPRRARPRLRAGLRPAGARGDLRRRGAALHRGRAARELRAGVRRDAQPRGAGGDRVVAGPRGHGHHSINYRLRDWLISRQRYWGCPIPIIHCEACGIVPVPEADLPVVLPDVEDYKPKGRSPLAAAEDWVRVDCPSCGRAARRETDTMDTFVDSSWYFLRYCDALNDEAAWDPEALDALDARRPVHRRRRARDPAPALRALLLQGAQPTSAICPTSRSRSRGSSRRG